ncbi:MAG: methyl-accepting chemotaxis protein [Bacteroidales bacterium]|jgi:methyl-accepting chemotaxis protein
MKKNKSILTKTIMTLGFPLLCIYLILVGTLLLILRQNIIDYDLFYHILGKILLIFGIGLVMMSSMFVWSMKEISSKITHLTNVINPIALVDKGIYTKNNDRKFSDQLEELNQGVSIIVKKNELLINIAQKMAEGDMSEAIQAENETDRLMFSLKMIQDAIKQLKIESENLQDNAKKNEDSKILAGDYKLILRNISNSIDTATGKADFYAGILDAIPYSLLVIDNKMQYKYINKQMAAYLKKIGAINERSDAYSCDCSMSATDLCETDNCAKKLLEKGISETTFETQGRYYKDYIAYIQNKNGEDTDDILEISLDQTSIMSVNVYIEEELERLSKNLLYLAEGNLNFDMDIQDGNKYTAKAHEQFETIGKNLGVVKQSIDNLIDDASRLNHAVIKGNLETRADETKFSGSWKTLISGMNEILIEIAKPLAEVSQVMMAISNGNLKAIIHGVYEGKFDELKQSVNNMGRSLNDILEEISIVTNKISNGNLDIENLPSYDGDFAGISNGLNAIIKTLNHLFNEINMAAEQVNEGANQVSYGSQSLSKGSTDQASSVQELTASIAEIAEQTKNNAANGNDAKKLATDVMDTAQNGNIQMAKMQSSMTEINQSSNDISKIIKVIDDIAFQTNILALNAAVEAARAGQHGKGFAVVAEEVRTLAARSADAAKVTSTLIEGSIEKVAIGTQIADETATALQEIVDGIKKTSDLVGNIADASNIQASSITQINDGIDQVSQVIQNNAATSQQSAAASEELLSQAEILRQMIAQFQLRTE